MRVKSAKGQLSKNDNMEVDSSVKSIEKDNVSIQENSSVSSSLLTAMLIGSIPSFQMGLLFDLSHNVFIFFIIFFLFL